MTMPLWRIASMTLAGTLLLAGCSHQSTRTGTAATGSTTQQRSGQPASATAARRTRQGSGAGSATATTRQSGEANAPSTPLPTSTGIPACDDYLASYKGCHRAAGIFAPNQLEGRYQAMRTSLLRDSQDPDIRPQLANRCNSLASQLRQALHGRACEVEPASTSTTPSPD